MSVHYRQSLISRIHIAKEQLDMDEKTYRDMLKLTVKKISCTKMTVPELIQVIERMRALGFKDAPAKRHGQKPNVSQDHTALLEKIEALLADQGRPWAYLTAKGEKPKSMLERITGKQAIQFCSATDMVKIVSALEYDKKRTEKQTIKESAA